MVSTGRASSSSEAVPAPQPADRRGPAPLSFSQERLWFIERLSPGSPAYNLHTTLRLTGPLDPDALHRSVQRLVDRHDVLRTTFHAGPDGTPFQRVTGELQVGLPVTDLTALPPDRRSDAARDLLAAWADEPFDLENGPLFRSRLVRLGPGEHILGLFLHHAVSDGWSVDLMFDEIAACYASPDGAAGQDEPVPQYAEFARRQREEELSPRSGCGPASPAGGGSLRGHAYLAARRAGAEKADAKRAGEAARLEAGRLIGDAGA